MKKVVLLMLIIIFTTEARASINLYFNDGQTHDISYYISGFVTVDFKTPGVRTTINWLDGAVSTGFSGSLLAYENSIINIYGGEVRGILYTFQKSQLYMYGGTVYNFLDVADNSIAVIYDGTFKDDIQAVNAGKITLMGGFIKEKIRAGGSRWCRSEIRIEGSNFKINGHAVNYGIYDAYDFSSGRLTGHLSNGDYLNNQFEINGSSRIVLAAPSKIEVTTKITPQTLNRSSNGKWLKAHFTLPEGYLVEDVDTEKPATIDSLTIISDHINVSYNSEGLVEVEVAFSRTDFCSIGLFGNVELTVKGYFADGAVFYGTASVRIIIPGLKELAQLSTYWLQSNCDKPDWCSGLDLNHDSIVNMLDFALFQKSNIEFIDK